MKIKIEKIDDCESTIHFEGDLWFTNDRTEELKKELEEFFQKILDEYAI
jgi:division protein CdvB (Snf7/Vps24/ESCRT-III family)